MLISARRLACVPLMGTDGRRLGTIREVIIDRHSGQVIYALMNPQDDRETAMREGPAYALPWPLVSYEAANHSFRLDADPEHLKRAPGASSDPPIDWEDRVWAERLHEHYGLQPYWTVRSSS